MYEIDYYESERGDAPVKEFLAKLSQPKELAQIKLSIARLEEYGFQMFQHFPKDIKKIRGDLYELRPGSNRVFFFYFTGSTFVLLHCYKKKSQEAPQRQIEKAETEIKSYLRRHRNE